MSEIFAQRFLQTTGSSRSDCWCPEQIVQHVLDKNFQAKRLQFSQRNSVRALSAVFLVGVIDQDLINARLFTAEQFCSQVVPNHSLLINLICIRRRALTNAMSLIIELQCLWRASDSIFPFFELGDFLGVRIFFGLYEIRFSTKFVHFSSYFQF